MGKASILFKTGYNAFTIIGVVTSIIAFVRYNNAKYSVVYLENGESFSLYAVKSNVNISTLSFSECTDFGGRDYGYINLNDFLKIFQNTPEKIWLSVMYWINCLCIVAFLVYEAIMKLRQDTERSCLYQRFKVLASFTFAPANYLLVCTDVTQPCVCFPNYLIRMTDLASYLVYYIEIFLPIYSFLIAIVILCKNCDYDGCVVSVIYMFLALSSISVAFGYLILIFGYFLSTLITISMVASSVCDCLSTSCCKCCLQ
jgi:hypothetical protein